MQMLHAAIAEGNNDIRIERLHRRFQCLQRLETAVTENLIHSIGFLNWVVRQRAQYSNFTSQF
jgi:hypothetical protein